MSGYYPNGCSQDQIDRMMEAGYADLEMEENFYTEEPDEEHDDEGPPPILWEPGLGKPFIAGHKTCECAYRECPCHVFPCRNKTMVIVRAHNDYECREPMYLCWDCGWQNGLQSDALVIVRELW